MKHVMITGVSTGIGRALANDLVARGYAVFGSVRRPRDAERVQRELGDRFTPLLFDVTDEAAVMSAAAQVRSLIGDQGLTALINNAGIVIPGPIIHMSLADFRQQLEVNVVGVLSVTQAFSCLLGAQLPQVRLPGRIINIGSVSGKIVYPFMGAYATAKHALEALSDALRRELMLYGIDVILIQPGTIRTPMMHKFGRQVVQYAETDYSPLLIGLERAIEERKRSALAIERVTRIIIKALESDKPRTRYAIPRRRLTGWLLPRLLPDRWFDRILARRLALRQ